MQHNNWSYGYIGKLVLKIWALLVRKDGEYNHLPFLLENVSLSHEASIAAMKDIIITSNKMSEVQEDGEIWQVEIENVYVRWIIIGGEYYFDVQPAKEGQPIPKAELIKIIIEDKHNYLYPALLP